MRCLLLFLALPFALAAETPNASSYEAAAAYLESCNGHALLVYERGRLVFERYFHGHSAATPHVLASGTKSFFGVLAVAAQEDGLLRLDEKLSDTLTEWRADPRKRDLTIRQLLSLSSGLAGGGIGQVPSYREAVASATVTAAPGQRFQYGPIPYQVFGELLRRKLVADGRAKDPLDYLQQRIFTPIGLRYDRWREDGDGLPHLPSGAYLTAREWAKFGLLVLDNGIWRGKPVIRAGSLAECFKPAPANPNYGLTFWKAKPDDPEPDLVMAAGKGKQKLFILPSRQLLIVQFADAERRYQERRFLDLALGDRPRNADITKPDRPSAPRTVPSPCE
jgi:CubicO group peptidase (beta-lactamase class C family)